jgi:hypothetical protein
MLAGRATAGTAALGIQSVFRGEQQMKGRPMLSRRQWMARAPAHEFIMFPECSFAGMLMSSGRLSFSESESQGHTRWRRAAGHRLQTQRAASADHGSAG